MLKNILNLEGAQQLNKTEQKSIQGGGPYSTGGCANKRCSNGRCGYRETCVQHTCNGVWEMICVHDGSGIGQQ